MGTSSSIPAQSGILEPVPNLRAFKQNVNRIGISKLNAQSYLGAGVPTEKSQMEMFEDDLTQAVLGQIMPTEETPIPETVPEEAEEK